ncbi:MAG: TlpA family protein disulfide reductase [Wenzhouxiangella sp.]
MKGMLAMLLVATVARAGEGIPVEVLEAPWTSVDGETIRLEEFRGRQPVYLKFWASWCSTCREEMPHLQSVYRDHGDEIAVIAVNLGINDDRQAVVETRDEFGLDMPIVIDRDGMLAQAFDLVATPYHVLLDRDLRLVHAEYSASAALDEKLGQLAAGNGRALETVETNARRAHAGGSTGAIERNRDSSGGVEVYFFVATWCDWYLEDTRPAMSRNCIDAQRVVNHLVEQWPDLDWTGVASRMWTGAEELASYRERFDVGHQLEVDASNETVLDHEIRRFPSLIVVDAGREILRIEEFGDPDAVAHRFRQAIADRAKSPGSGSLQD